MMTKKEKIAVVANVLAIVCVIGCVAIIFGVLTAPTKMSSLLLGGVLTTVFSAIPVGVACYKYYAINGP